jgi:lipoyl-dependent peroxiredoxin subunit D
MELVIALVKNKIPDYAKDLRLNLDSVVGRSPLDKNIVLGCVVASAFAAKNTYLLNALQNDESLDSTYIQAALTAASLMAMNNTWYPYVEMTADEQLKTLAPGLRMNAYATHGGIDKNHFEMFALAASIIGKCHFCVASHYQLLKQAGIPIEELKEIGKIASIINAVSHII